MNNSEECIRPKHRISKYGVNFLGSIPRQILPVITTAGGRREEFSPEVLQEGWTDKQLDPLWQEKHDGEKLAALVAHRKRLIHTCDDKLGQPVSVNPEPKVEGIRKECGRRLPLTKIERKFRWQKNARPYTSDDFSDAGYRQDLEAYSKSGFTEFKHLLFTDHEWRPWAVDPPGDDGSFLNTYGEIIEPFQTTYDIAYNIGDKFKFMPKQMSQDRYEKTYTPHPDNLDLPYISTYNTYHRSVGWQEKRPTCGQLVQGDDLADKYRPAFIKNNLGCKSVNVSCQTAKSFLKSWRKEQWPATEIREILDSEYRRQPCSNERTVGCSSPRCLACLAEYKPVANGGCRRETLCASHPCGAEECILRVRKLTRPDISPSEVGIELEISPSEREKSSGGSDLLLKDKDFGLDNCTVANQKTVDCIRKMQYAATQTPTYDDMREYWDKKCRDFDLKINRLDGDLGWVKIKREIYEDSKTAIDSSGRLFEVPFELRPEIELQAPLNNKPRRQCYGDIPPPTKGWTSSGDTQ